jgi:hypothetical protein
MILTLMIAASAGAMTPASAAAASAQIGSIDWTIKPTTRSVPAESVHLSLSYRTGSSGHNMNSRSVPLRDLQGLSRLQLASREGAPTRFRIVREAGTLDCEGLVRQERGTGECRFDADSAYAAALERRGIGRPTMQQQYQMAVQNVGLGLIDELDRQGYRRPSMNSLMAAAIHGVSIPYVRSLADAGYRLGSVDDLVKFRIHGVDADFIRGMSSVRGTRFTADQLVAMRIHRVSPAKVREFADLGYRSLTMTSCSRCRSTASRRPTSEAWRKRAIATSAPASSSPCASTA